MEGATEATIKSLIHWFQLTNHLTFHESDWLDSRFSIGSMDTDLKLIYGTIAQYMLWDNCIDHAHTVLVSMIPVISCSHYLKDCLIYTQMVTFEHKTNWTEVNMRVVNCTTDNSVPYRSHACIFCFTLIWFLLQWSYNWSWKFKIIHTTHAQ